MSPGSNSPVAALLMARGLSDDALALTAETFRDFGIATVTLPPMDSEELPADLPAQAKAQGWRAVIVASEDARLPAAVARVAAQPVIRVPFGPNATPGLALLQNEEGDLPNSAGSDEPFATVAIGAAGAKNAALFVVSLLALDDERLRDAWEAFRAAQTDAVLRQPPPSLV